MRMMKVILIRKHFISIYFQHIDLRMHLDELKDGVFATDVSTRSTADIITVFSNAEKWANQNKFALTESVLNQNFCCSNPIIFISFKRPNSKTIFPF